MNWKVGRKVFETEEEAISFCKALARFGCVPCWGTTTEEVTHIHLGDGMTEEV